jgi:hypothetical protein
MLAPAMEYMVDAAQRIVLFWDLMRQRGNQFREHEAEIVPHVLDYEAELVIDGRTLPRPVNYALARIIPPAKPPAKTVVVQPCDLAFGGGPSAWSRERPL